MMLEVSSPFRTAEDDRALTSSVLADNRRLEAADDALAGTLPRPWREPTLEIRALNELADEHLTLQGLIARLRCSQSGAMLALARLLHVRLIARTPAERSGRSGRPEFLYTLHPRMLRPR